MGKSIEEVVEKDYPHFMESVQALTTEQLEERLIKNAKEREQVNRAKKLDLENTDSPQTLTDLAKAGLGYFKAKKDNAEAPYKDALKALKVYDEYIIKLIEDKGGNIEGESTVTEDNE